SKIAEDGLRNVHHYVTCGIPGQEYAGFGASHGIDRSVQETNARMPASRIGKDPDPALRAETRGIVFLPFRSSPSDLCFGRTANLFDFDGGVVMATRVLQPVGQVALRSFDFNGQILAPRTELWNPGTQNRIGRWAFGINVTFKVPQCNHAEALLF